MIQCIASGVDPVFLEKLADPTFPFKDAMSNPQIVALAKFKKVSLLSKYFESHPKDILDLVLSDEKSTAGSNLVTILIFTESTFLRTLVTDPSLNVRATTTLLSENPADITIARLAHLTTALLLWCPKEAPIECSYYFIMLKFCHNHTVFSMFMNTMADETAPPEIHQWLADMDFVNYILLELESMNYDYELPEGANPYEDRVFRKASCLYEILTRCSRNTVLKDRVLCTATVPFLKKRFKNPPKYVLTAYWKLVRELCCEATASLMSTEFADLAMSVLAEDSARISEHQVLAVNFICKLIESLPDASSKLCESSLTVWMVQLLLSHPNSSILHSAFRKFVDVSMTNEVFSLQVIELIAPMLITEAMTTKNRVLLPTLYYAMQIISDKVYADLEKYKHIIANIPEFHSFCKNDMKKYQELCGKSYGHDLFGRLAKLGLPFG